MIQKTIILISIIGLLLISGCAEDEPAVLEVGSTAPDFQYRSLMQLEAELQKLSLQKGKVIYLDFWASWCKPCLQSMPLLNELRAELTGSDFEVIAVNLDNQPEDGQAFISQYPVDYPVVRASHDYIQGLYQITGLPTSYLIDKEGILHSVHNGFRPNDIALIRKEVLSLLND